MIQTHHTPHNTTHTTQYNTQHHHHTTHSPLLSPAVRRGVHPSYESLTTRLAIGDKRTLNRLHGICSLLAHWSPVFGEVKDISPPPPPPVPVPYMPYYSGGCYDVLLILWRYTYPIPLCTVLHSISHCFSYLSSSILHSQCVFIDLFYWTVLSIEPTVCPLPYL